MNKETTGIFLFVVQICVIALSISLIAGCVRSSKSKLNGLTSVAKVKDSHLFYTLIWDSSGGDLHLSNIESVNVAYYSSNGSCIDSQSFVLALSSKFTSQEISSSKNKFELVIPSNCATITVQLGKTKLKNKIRLGY